jgi:hypothetical protein
MCMSKIWQLISHNGKHSKMSQKQNYLKYFMFTKTLSYTNLQKLWQRADRMSIKNWVKMIGWRIWNSHNSVYEEVYVLGYNTVQSIENQLCFSACYLLPAGYLLGLFFDPEDGGDHVPLKCQMTFSGLYSVISEKIEPLMIGTFNTWQILLLCC